MTSSRPTLEKGSPDVQNGRRTGEGIDRKIEKKTWTPARIAMLGGVLLFVALIAYGISTTTGGKRLNVELERVTIAPVVEGPFQELITVTGSVLPRTTIYLDAVDGGRVEEIFVREGEVVDAGQPILRLSNNDLQLRLLNAEAQRIEQTNRLQNTRFSMEMNSLNLRQQLAEMNFQIERTRRRYEQSEELFEKQLIARRDYEDARDEYQYWERRRLLTVQGFEQDSLRMEQQLRQMAQALDRLEQNFAVIQDNLENLTLRAPIGGQLTALNAEVGEIRNAGFRFGQVDAVDGYKVRAPIDEFYIARVQRGQSARGEVAGREYQLVATRVYPEVREGRFEVDFEFAGEPPEGIRRGQTLRFRLEMSDPAHAVMLPRGGFYQTTGGNWIFVVSPSGDFAVRRPIQIGRQNPSHFELVEGLEPGERVVTSSYETFGDAERLVFK